METSYNGWTASPNAADFGGLTKLVVDGEEFAPGVRSGDVFTVFQYFATQFNRRVERLYKPGWHEADDWGFSYRPNRNANNLSCHASATAIDCNATRHPNGKRGTFTSAQAAEIRKICGELRNVVRWGGDFTGTIDEMHVEVCGNEAQVKAAANWVRGVGGPTVLVSARVLEYGMTDPEVKRLQDILVSRFSQWAKWSPTTNYFGIQTMTAVKAIQKAHGLVADGIVGPATRRVLGM